LSGGPDEDTVAGRPGATFESEDGLAAPLARDGDPEAHIEEPTPISASTGRQLPHRGGRHSSSSIARPTPSSD